MAEFFTFAAGVLGKLGISLAGREIGEAIKDIRTKRRMERMVEDAVDRIVEQIDEFLTSEGIADERKCVLVSSLSENLQHLVDDPQQLFAGNLDGDTIFKQVHSKKRLPPEITENELGHFYSMLFPQVAHFLAGSRIALQQWQAEGYREEFKRLTQIAEEIRAINMKVADLPSVVTEMLITETDREAERVLREFSQTLLNTLLFRLDLSPLRAERSLHGSLRKHFVVPEFRERKPKQKPLAKERKPKQKALATEQDIIKTLADPSSRMIIHGGAGTGKTTWSLWMQSRLLESEQRRLAVVFRLREYPEIEKHSVLDLLKDRAGAHLRDEISNAGLQKWHKSGRLIVILDGFDEIPEERRDDVEKWITTLGIAAKGTAIIVTSRPLQSGHLERMSKAWRQWDLLPFDESRIVDFIDRWHRYLPDGELSPSERDVDAATLAATFLKDSSLRPLADTPLMLGTLLFVHHRDKRLPSGRVDLYERYISAMLGLRDSGMGIRARATKLTDKQKRIVLSHVALHFHQNGVNEVGDELMRNLVGNALVKFNLEEDANRLLPALHERTGLLQGPGAWSFMHKTIGEFLVAELVCEGMVHLDDKRRLDRKELWNHRFNDSWTSVLFFWAGRTSTREFEEFLSDLAEDESPQAQRLILSLIHDQGERLPRESQRSFLRRAILRSFVSGDRSFSYGIHTPHIPPFAYSHIDASRIDLRGLHTADVDVVLEDLFRREVLISSDVSDCNEEIRGNLTIAALHAEQAWTCNRIKDLFVCISHLPRQEVALQCFCVIFFRSLSVEDFNRAVRDWINAFPEGSSWVNLLIVCFGSVSFERKSNSHFRSACQFLVGNLDRPIDDRFLQETRNCRGFGKSGGIDSLLIFSSLFNEWPPEEVGVTADQYSTISAWCRSLIKVRDSQGQSPMNR